MATNLSRWRASARRIIAEVLATLPPDATDKGKRKALSDAASRSATWSVSWPYKCWLREVAIALGTPKEAEPERRVRWAVRGGRVAVLCDWCSLGSEIHGCLMCRTHRDTLRALSADPEFAAGQATICDDPDCVGPRSVLADWLEERGYTELSEMLRETTKEASP